MKIQIINGVYGYRPNAYTVEKKTLEDPPFEVDDTEATRLISKGVAKAVVDHFEPSAVEQSAEEEPTETYELPEYNADMKLTELKEIAAAYGVDASKARSKAEAIALIDAAIGVGEGEDVPQLGAALPE